MLIEIDDDFLDMLVSESLAATYVSLERDAKRATAHPEDLEHWVNLLPHLKAVLQWYTNPRDLEIRLKKAKEKLGE